MRGACDSGALLVEGQQGGKRTGGKGGKSSAKCPGGEYQNSEVEGETNQKGKRRKQKKKKKKMPVSKVTTPLSGVDVP